ncbi:MAG: YdcF family protein, partial [Eubacteriales bacterium]
MKRTKPLGILSLIANIIVLVCYGVYFTVSIIERATLGGLIIPAAVILLALIPLIFYKKLPKWLNIVFMCGMWFYTVTFAIFCGTIMTYHSEEQAAQEVMQYSGDNGEGLTVLVFGCRTYEQPSKSLARRLDSAYDLLQRYPAALCIVSGAQGANEPRTEASSMRDYLIGLGIAQDRIYAEERATSTEENIALSLELIERTPELAGRHIICVSSDFHLARIALLMKRETDGNYSLAGAPSPRFELLWANLV